MYGFHLSEKKNIIEEVKEYKKYKCKLVQIMPESVDKIPQLTEFKVIMHSSFYINTSNLTYYMINRILQEIDICKRNNIKIYVLHIGKIMKDKTEKEAINSMYTLLKIVSNRIKYDKITICIEMLSGMKNDILYRLEDLEKVYNKMKKDRNMKKIKICVDTCHVYASGYDISKKEGLKKYILEFNKRIGIENIGIIHLNDSKHEYNSRKDEHDILTKGHIGEILRDIYKIAEKNKIPIIFESKGTVKENIENIFKK